MHTSKSLQLANQKHIIGFRIKAVAQLFESLALFVNYIIFLKPALFYAVYKQPRLPDLNEVAAAQ